MRKKGNLKKEIEFFLKAAQNNAIRTYYIKARIDKKQQNSRCRLCSDRDETINHIISECRKLAQKVYKTKHDWVGRWSIGNCARNLMLTIRTNSIYITRIRPENWNAQLPLVFWDTNGLPNLGQMTRPCDSQQKKKKKKKKKRKKKRKKEKTRTCQIMDFAVPADHRIKVKEKKDKYLNLARELKKLWNMKVIPVVTGVLGTVTKGLIKGLEDLEIRGRVETIQTTTLLRSARILRRVLETCGDLLSLKFQW